jgi:hypothetical protein
MILSTMNALTRYRRRRVPVVAVAFTGGRVVAYPLRRNSAIGKLVRRGSVPR